MRFPFIQGEKNEEVILVPVEDFIPNPYQPRIDFQEEEIKELALSIKSYGVIQPLIVRKDTVQDNKFQLIAGERRLRAAKLLVMENVPAIVRDFNDMEIAELALVENLQRKDLSFMEEALAYRKLINEFNLTQEELAEKIGKSQSTIANKLRLLKLPDIVLHKLNNPLVSERHARSLLKITDESLQLEIADIIINEGLTVRETEKMIEKRLNQEKEQKKKVITVFKDLRIFTNTLNKTIKDMRDAGLVVDVDKEDRDDYIEYTIRLPRNVKG